jgi:zinc protease
MTIARSSRAQSAAPCRGPLSEQQLSDLISGKMSQSRIIDLITTCKLGFPVNSESVARLKLAGASDEVLQVIQKAAPDARQAISASRPAARTLAGAKKNDIRVPKVQTAKGSSSIPLRQFTLNNGLRVVLSEDHSASTYSIAVTYKVGSRDEKPGQTGYAHLLEHMMFEGSENVGKGEHLAIIQTSGGTGNAYGNGPPALSGPPTAPTPPPYTPFDDTKYFETLPSNQLDLGLFLEADRMRSLIINQANLDNQRAAVQDERQRLDNQPYARAAEAIYDVTYDNFSYKHSKFGSTSDVNSATVTDITNFFRRYYAPNNAVLTLVGDFDERAARALVEKYFGTIPRQPTAPLPNLYEPPQQAERRKEIEDPFATRERVDIAYKGPPGNIPDSIAWDVLCNLLGNGQASRLYTKLVREAEVADSFTENVDSRAGVSLLRISAAPRSGKSVAQVERLIYDEIEHLVSEGATRDELDRVRRQSQLKRAEAFKKSLQRAIALGESVVLFDDANLVNSYDERFNRVSSNDLRAVAAKYLSDSNRSVVSTKPATGTGRPAIAETARPISIASVERKNRAPISGEILRVHFPKPVMTRLENGLTILVLEDHRFPTVTIQFSISGAGCIYDPADLPGLASITAQLLTQGTTSASSREIQEKFAMQGATVGASSGFGSSVATVVSTGLRDTFEEWFPGVTELLLHPTFPIDELNSIKQRLRALIPAQRASPLFLVQERFHETIYGKHPARVIAPTLEAIDKLKPELLKQWHDQTYTPENTVLSIVGDVRAAEVIAYLKTTQLTSWHATGSKEQIPPDPLPAKQRKLVLVDRPNSTQASLMVGNIAINRTNPEFVLVEVANEVLGGSGAGRLLLNLREQHGYTSGAYSGFTSLKYAGPWNAHADVRADVVVPALHEMIGEIERLAKEPVSDAELSAVKRGLAANFALSLEDPSQILAYALISHIYGFSTDYWDKFPARIMATNAGEVSHVVAEYLDVNKLQIVVVGDAKKLLPSLSVFGPVELYDTNGKRVSEQ